MDEVLRDVRVLDLSQNLAGPYATQILADLGADVIKVEPPAGDAARAWGPPFIGSDSPLFLCANRGKRSIALDLRDDDDRGTLRRLTRHADVFVQALRPGAIQRLGFGYEQVRALRPDVVYLSVSAYGEEGPLGEQPGYDPLMQAFAGIMSVTGEPDGEPVRVGTSIIDLGTGTWAALATLAALRRRDRSGEGSHVRTALLDTALGLMSYHLQAHLADGSVPRAAGTALGSIAPYEAFPTRDGRVMIAAANDGLFARLCGALGLIDLPDDARFRSNADRVAAREILHQRIAAETARRSTEALLTLLHDADVPCAPIHDVAQVAADPQVRATGMLRPNPAGHLSHYQEVALPASWDGRRTGPRPAPPRPGQHRAEILAELDRLDATA